MLDKVILYSFYALFFATPLFWTPLNYELFEYNKMVLVYFLTTIIVGCWLLKSINNKQLTINHTPLDIPILLFLGANILSTHFSIDHHTSVWGYYSRSNGGLLSILSYTLLFYAFVSNINKENALKILKVGLLGGLVVALWAIPEHFGVSPSCIILRWEFNASCWIQDVQARVFASLGQPNWLASYLAMLIFPALYFALTAATKKLSTIYYLLSTIYYLAFTFTYSRGGTLGFLGGSAFLVAVGILRYKDIKKNILQYPNILISIVVIFLLINLIFGSAITRFNLSQYLSASHPSQPTRATSAILTQLETGGTDAGKIRLIVWRGAFDIFKHYPILGSGVETFAYSYYLFRPAAHNLVSEWDFLYNKAHNEYLNYLANTGIVGFSTYLIMIITFITIILKRPGSKPLLSLTLLASYISYLVHNFFLFSVVITALFFYLFPAIALTISDSTKPLRLPKQFYTLHSTLYTLIYRRNIYTQVVKVVIVLSTLYFLFSILKIWYADTLFKIGEKASEAGNPGRAYNYLTSAVTINPHEPFYHSELGYGAGAAAAALSDSDATLSSKLKNLSIRETQRALKTSPNNTSFWRTAIRTYYQLTTLSSDFNQKTLDTLDKTISLAPTDPKLYYNKSIILGQINQNDLAIEALKKAIELKPNYREAYFALSLFYFDQHRTKEAVETMYKVLELVPSDPDALSQLNDWGKEGIATESGKTR